MQTEDDSAAYQTVMLVVGAGRLMLEKWAVLARYLSGPLLLVLLLGWLLGGLPRQETAGVAGHAWPWLVQTLLNAYLVLLALRVLTGTRGPEVFRLPSRQTVNFLLASLLVWLLASIGFVLLIVPGLVVLAATVAWPVLLVEEDQRPVQAVTNSLEYVQGYLFDISLAFIALALTLALGNWLLSAVLVDTFLSERQYQVLAFAGTCVVGVYLASLSVMVYHRRPDLHQQGDVEPEDDAPEDGTPDDGTSEDRKPPGPSAS